VPLLAQLVPSNLPIAATPTVDLRVLLCAVALTACTGLAFGLAPVLRAGAGPSIEGLREGARAGGGRKERLRSALVVAEILASVVLLVSAGLLIRALDAVRGTDPGFEPAGVLTLRAELPQERYGAVAAREDFYTRVREEVEALPGVSSAGFISFLPMSSFRGGIWPVLVPGDTEAGTEVRSANNVAGLRYVTAGYFDAMGIPLRRGRPVLESDTAERPFVAVVSESFVRRYWPNQDPIGARFTFAFADREVVGVAGDVRFRGLERTSEPQVYLSSSQVPDEWIAFYAPRALAVRTGGDPAALTQEVRAIIQRADPTVAITEVQTLTDLVARDTGSRAVQVRVLAAFAVVAFLLAAVGIHGLLSFAVSQRTPEIGLRMALGAESTDIVWMIVRRGAILAVAGILPGLLLAYLAGRSLEALLAGVEPADIVTLSAAVGFALLMTILGGLAPTIRALRVDPLTALRSE
jgi:putative ABC transport system permease protein